MARLVASLCFASLAPLGFLGTRFGERFVVRLTGSNLLDSSKDEIFDKFTMLQDQTARSYDEYEIETEKAGPVSSWSRG